MSETWLQFFEGKIDANAVLEKYKEQGITDGLLTKIWVCSKSMEPWLGAWIRRKSKCPWKYALGRTLCSKSKGSKSSLRSLEVTKGHIELRSYWRSENRTSGGGKVGMDLWNKKLKDLDSETLTWAPFLMKEWIRTLAQYQTVQGWFVHPEWKRQNMDTWDQNWKPCSKFDRLSVHDI